MPEKQKFASEEEEAKWWFEHREQVGRDLVAASREKRSGGGVAARAREVKQGEKAKLAARQTLQETV